MESIQRIATTAPQQAAVSPSHLARAYPLKPSPATTLGVFQGRIFDFSPGSTTALASTTIALNTLYSGTYYLTSATRATLYLNGNQVATTTNVPSVTITPGNAAVGASPMHDVYEPDRGWIGNISELIIYDLVMDDSTRETIEGSGATPNGVSVKRYFGID